MAQKLVSDIQLSDDEMYRFINKTQVNDVFILPFGNDAIFIPLIRSECVLESFPFSEGSFLEYYQRKNGLWFK